MHLAERKSSRAFTVPELLIVVFTLFIVAGLMVPRFARARVHVCPMNCVNNLKQTGLAFRTWALDNNDKYPMQVSVTNGGTMELVASGWVYPQFQVASNELSTPRILLCPQDTSRTNALSFSRGFDNRNISYFLGIDAVDINPQALLAGDDNLLVSGKRVKRGLLGLWTNTAATWSTNRHGNRGNLCQADGSVQQLSGAGLALVLRSTGMATNRLLMP